MQRLIDKYKTYGHDFDKRNEKYYIEAFRKLDEGIDSWNWGSFFMGWAWAAYRKAYALSVKIIFTMACLNGLLGFILFINSNASNIWSLAIAAQIASQLIYMCFMGYFGNRLYYNSLKKKIPLGYHVIDTFYPIASVFLFLGIASFFAGLACTAFISFFIFYRLDRSAKLKYIQEHGFSKEDLIVDKENIRRYLNPGKEASFKHKIASWFVAFVISIVTITSYEGLIGTYVTVANEMLRIKIRSDAKHIDKNHKKQTKSSDIKKVEDVQNVGTNAH